jgi:dissimilatory sulfite reductase (desulfoviridin) alpha/beta subunit
VMSSTNHDQARSQGLRNQGSSCIQAPGWAVFDHPAGNWGAAQPHPSFQKHWTPATTKARHSGCEHMCSAPKAHARPLPCEGL